ncbi:MAG: HNH endonuclease [Steroidobacteraceae bacterium]|nr:HNH endonuclease [Steroidobacteraceae bacterium]
MRYWWVNQNQTYRHEVAGGYLWSPKRKANGHLNPFYEFMREVAPGDVIFSFADTFVRAIGIAKSHCYECPKPLEFGSVGMNWEQVGWKIDVEYRSLSKPIRPAANMVTLAPLLPERYSPLSANGHGSQSVYLTGVPAEMAHALAGLIGHEARRAMEVGNTLAQDTGLSDRPAQALAEWEEHLRSTIENSSTITETEKQQLVLSRRGQGKFRDNVSRIETHCRITGVNRPEHLIASHCKPWRDSDNAERLDGENGLLLTPSIDHLFDRGFIGFENNGELLVSPVAHQLSLKKMGVPLGRRVNVGRFSAGQRKYLEFHRESVFLQAVRRG